MGEGDLTAGLENRDACPSSLPLGAQDTCQACLSSACEQRLPAWSGVCSVCEFHVNAPRWGQLGSWLGPLPMAERGPHPGFSNHPGPNFREFPDPLPTVPDAPGL